MMAIQSLFLIMSLLAVAYGQGKGALRFYRNGLTSTSYTSGILEIYYGDWGNICHSWALDFYVREAEVACHQLGYSGYSSYGSSGSISSYGNDSRSAVIDKVDCSDSSYLALLQCSYSTVVSSSCTDDTDVYVSCYSTKIWDYLYPTPGQIRLTGGSYAGQGLLEVYCNGQWGTVCDDGFDSTDANVACRQLGYSDNYNYNHLSITGTSSQPIWLTNVPCSSSNTSCLVTCGRSCPLSQVSNCGHSKDVTLECEFSTSSKPTTTEITCLSAGISGSISAYYSTIGAIVGGIIAAIVLVVVIIILIITIILSICCCLGVGIGAAFNTGRRRERTTVVTTQPNTVVVSSDINTQHMQQLPSGYAPIPATGYMKPVVYPPYAQL